MKKHLLFIPLLVLISVNFFGQSIPNGGFEGWQVTSYQNPKYYGTSNYEKKEALTQVSAVRVNDAYHGQYAIKLTTSGVSTGTQNAFAYLTNFQPDLPISSGGIPYNQKPTGIRFHYKSNILPGDTAIFICMFKKNGVQLGLYLYKFATTQTSYTLFDVNFNLSATPDTIGIACASSMAFNNSLYQAGNSIQIDSVMFKGVSSQPLNFNGDFELWDTKSNDNLNGWETSGSFSRTTDVYSGTYALELQTVGPSLNDPQVRSGGVYTSKNAPTAKGGFPFAKQMDTLVFFYKYLPADPTDKARVYVWFKKNGVNVAQTFTTLPISVSYKQVVFPFNVGQVPDSINISIESSTFPMQSSYIGSDLKIDNLYLKSQTIPISDFISPSFGCVGLPIQLTDNSANMPNAWGWIMPGGTPGSSTINSPTVIYMSPGTKTITMVSNNQFGAGTPVSRTITIYQLPTVASTSTVTACGGGNAVLIASGANTYTWSTGANTSSISVTPSVTTVYTVVGSSNGCSDAALGVVVVPQTPKPDICMVTVDSLNNYNEIYWDKASYPNLDSMIVYREVMSNVYRRIGAVSKNALSMWKDTARSIGPANGDPKISTYRYKIQVRDTCGQYGPKSLWHNTIFFTHNGSGTFFWTSNYMIEGPLNPVQTYSLLVNTNPTLTTSSFVPVGTTSGNQSTLADPFYNFYASVADWRVEADLGYSCNATLRQSGNTGALLKSSKTRSNIQNNRTIGVNEIEFKNRFRVYPNPSNGIVTIQTTLFDSETNLVVRNLLGQEIFTDKILKATPAKTINLGAISEGVYALELSNNNNKAVYKLIID